MLELEKYIQNAAQNVFQTMFKNLVSTTRVDEYSAEPGDNFRETIEVPDIFQDVIAALEIEFPCEPYDEKYVLDINQIITIGLGKLGGTELYMEELSLLLDMLNEELAKLVKGRIQFILWKAEDAFREGHDGINKQNFYASKDHWASGSIYVPLSVGGELFPVSIELFYPEGFPDTHEEPLVLGDRQKGIRIYSELGKIDFSTTPELSKYKGMELKSTSITSASILFMLVISKWVRAIEGYRTGK